HTRSDRDWSSDVCSSDLQIVVATWRLASRADTTERSPAGTNNHAGRTSGRNPMVTHVDVDVPQLWRDYRAEPTTELRNQLVELRSEERRVGKVSRAAVAR